MERLGLRPFWTEPNLVYVHLTSSKRPDLTEVCTQNTHIPCSLLTIFGPTNSIRSSTFAETTNSSLTIRMNPAPSERRARHPSCVRHQFEGRLGWMKLPRRRLDLTHSFNGGYIYPCLSFPIHESVYLRIIKAGAP